MVLLSEKPLLPRAYADSTQSARRLRAPTLLVTAATVAALYLGQDIFLPLAMAILLTFALAPVVSWLRRFRTPRPVAVVAVVIGAFAAIALFGMVVASQLGTLALNLPTYQRNIEAKVESIKSANVGEGIFSRVSRLLERLGKEIQADDPQPAAPASVEPAQERKPIPVEVVEPALRPFQVLQAVIGPLLQPLATGGIIIVVVIFMLMNREDLRDRFIRLVGSDDLHRTTAALQDAGKRVGQYLLMQLVVNVTYAIPVGVGLWIIGVPNAPLWGLLALVLRFVPYIGPIIASVFPLALALAADPGWSMLAWTAALFVAVELISNNFIEPWLYGSRTGLSPLAVIVSAVFWTWLWGPLGLLLSTPLTVCLVVLGRHVPQFEFLDVLFGNEPVLEPHQQLYQRLLSGDPLEATDRAEEYLDDRRLVTFYDRVGIPALLLGEADRVRGVLDDERRQRVAESARAVVENLAEFAEEERDEDDEEETEENDDEDEDELPDGTGRSVLCIGGRGRLDDVAADMLAQVLEVQGATVRSMDHEALEPANLRKIDVSGLDTVVIGFLNAASEARARYMIRRLRRLAASLRIGVVFWGEPAGEIEDAKIAAGLGCDFFARSMHRAVEGTLSEERIEKTPARTRRVRPVKRRPAAKRQAVKA
jgi:predicted PurR-regulated permease PerM